MIEWKHGSMFYSQADVLTNTVNCVGVMGKGIALIVKKTYPEAFTDYKIRCANGDVHPGVPYLFEKDDVRILNFPTKNNWRDGSRLEWIESGLKWIARNYKEKNISWLALPPIGCGNGGLHWPMVRSLIETHLGKLPGLHVEVYEP